VAHASESDVSDLSCTLNKSKFRNRATREQQVDAIVFCLHRCMGCQGGASAVGLGGIVGEVEAGRLADCVLYDLQRSPYFHERTRSRHWCCHRPARRATSRRWLRCG
jgi:hypothetical protein